MSNATNTQKSTSPAFNAFSVSGDGKDAYWNRVGAAWYHKDGKGLNIILDAHPVKGRLVLRTPRIEATESA